MLFMINTLLLLFQLYEISLDEDENTSDKDHVESQEEDKTFERPERKISEDTDQRSSGEIAVNVDNYDVDRNFQNPKTEEVHQDGDAIKAKESEPETDQVIPRKWILRIPPRSLLFLIILQFK